MKKFISYKKIIQIRDVIKSVNYYSSKEGIIKPIISFEGTCKLHGTNASVSFLNSEKKHDIWCQSKNNILSFEQNNCGFYDFFKSHENIFNYLFSKFKMDKNCIITIFGEWCGGNIQKGTALNQLPKMFVIFDVKITSLDDNFTSFYLTNIKHIKNHEYQIYNIHDFLKFNIDIDFEKPELSINEIKEYVLAVEKKCPVGDYFGVYGVGEGIVWRNIDSMLLDLTFKTKGEKHKISKSKKLISIDPEKIKSIDNFIKYAVTENRLLQGIDQVFISNSISIDITKTSDFLKWMVNDILAEESDVLIENKIESKYIVRPISNFARNWFINYLDNNL